FNTMSSGFSAVWDIISDLILKMERATERSFIFDIPGIVLIDEIETHLHLKMQKNIMTILTTIFPNIQFIVSTHSPFILNSGADAVIYDLQKRLLVRNGLSDVPYSGIVEGYFDVGELSFDLEEKFRRFRELIGREKLSDNELEEIADLEFYLDEIPDYLALDITTEYQRMKLEFEKRGEIR
ncbi:MAG: AAA family ATPase, partial [Lachnospiraceae bacterium]|nr:AAA family ATPase [Lachnospiraceae bacterium]